jgi:hypothetical protein
MATKVLTCTCRNAFQDSIYGPGRRLHNSMEKDKRLTGWRCTVCGHTQEGKKEDQPIPDKVKGKLVVDSKTVAETKATLDKTDKSKAATSKKKKQGK